MAVVSRMVKCPHSLTFKFDSDMTYFFISSHNKILLKMSDGNRKPTDVEMFLLKSFEKNNQTGNCIM